MIPNQKLFFLVLLIPIVKSTFQLYFVNELEAKCLDGSPGVIYEYLNLFLVILF